MNDLCNPKAEYLFKIGAKDFSEEIRSRILREYDQLEEYERTASPNFAQRLTSLVNNGWKLGDTIVNLSAPLQWNSGSRSHQFHFHAWEPLGVLLSGYSSLNNSEAFKMSVNIATDWIERFQKQYFLQTLQTGLNSALSNEATMAWYDMSVGQRAPRLAYLLDVVARQEGSDELTNALFRSLIFQLEMLSIEAFWKSHNNHGLYQALGQLAASRRFRYLPGFEYYYTLAQKRTNFILRKQFFESGIHTEHSPAYHRMVSRTISGALRGGLIEDANLVAMLTRSEKALRWMTTPDGSLVTFGDTDYGQNKIDNENAPTGLIAHIDAGYIFARHAGSSTPSEDSYFAQMAAFHSRTHKHADHLTFVWHEAGKRILVDPGRYGYGPQTVLGDKLSNAGFFYSDPNRRYIESTRAHNCVEIDGIDHRRKGAKPFGSALLFAEENNGLWLTLCEVRYQYVRHFRSIIIAPGSFLLVIDWLKDGKGQEHDYRQWFQLAPEWTATTNGNALTAKNNGCQITAFNLINEAAISPIYIGQKDPMQGWISPRAEKLIPSPSFNFYQRGVEARFASLFCLANDVKIEKTSFNGIMSKGEIHWTTKAGLHTLRLTRDGTILSGELSIAAQSRRRWLSFPKWKSQ